MSKTHAIVTLLKQGLNKVPKYNGLAYRALEFKEKELAEFMLDLEKKEVKYCLNFLSCGSTKEAAFFDKPQKNVRIVMEVKDAPDISSTADGIRYRGYELRELLLDLKTEFLVEDVYKEFGITYLKYKQIMNGK